MWVTDAAGRRRSARIDHLEVATAMASAPLVDSGFRLRRRVGGYREYDLPPGSPVTGRLWRYDAGGRLTVHRVLPTTAVTLCVEYRRAAGAAVRDPRVLLLGPVASIRFFAPPQDLAMEAVELPPELCRDLLGIAPEEHVDAIEDLEEVSPSLAGTLLHRLQPVAQADELPMALLDWLEHRWAETAVGAAANLAHFALTRLRSVSGAARLEFAAADLGYSPRHLRRVIRAVAGVSPKYLLRVMRLDAAMAEADGRRTPSWAEIAAGHGYCDQSHLIRDFRALTLVSPGELHRERQAETPAR